LLAGPVRFGLGNPLAVATLLEELRTAGDDDAVRALADRAVREASLDSPTDVAELLNSRLRGGGVRDRTGRWRRVRSVAVPAGRGGRADRARAPSTRKAAKYGQQVVRVWRR
jgi:hypothetical protein